MSTRDSKFDVAKTQAYAAQLDPEEWVDAHGDYLFRYANSRLQDIQAAEEVVQDTFVAALRHQAQFSGSGSERSWLLAILKRKLVDQLRKRSKLEESWGGETDPTVFFFDEKGRWRPDKLPHIGPDEQLNTGELWEVVKACLKKLPIGQADVFVLSVMEEMTTEEICKELEISASNLWVRLHRARLSLARCVSLNWFSDDEIREFHD